MTRPETLAVNHPFIGDKKSHVRLPDLQKHLKVSITNGKHLVSKGSFRGSLQQRLWHHGVDVTIFRSMHLKHGDSNQSLYVQRLRPAPDLLHEEELSY